MLHELLLALSGYPGSIFVQGEHEEVKVASDLPFIHPSELDLLNRLCQLATHYRRYITFIRQYGDAPGKVCREGLHGLYLKSFCHGLNEVLEPYRESLLSLENELLGDPHLSAACVQSSLDEYQVLFPALSNVLEQIEQQQVHGCYILEILHKAAVIGIPRVRQAFLRILFVCHAVLYKQLAAWMLHGMLLDQYGEFFIEINQRGPMLAGLMPSGPMPLGPMPVEEDELGLGGVTGRQLQQILRVSGTQESSLYEQYTIRAENLPSYIPTRVAEKILFIGESVQMFEAVTPGTRQGHRGSILRGRQDDFSKELHQLSRIQTFDLMTFEMFVDKVRTYVAERLWRLVVEESDLLGNLRIMKDFFLLGRGELFLAFIDQAQTLLRPIPSGTTDHDINMAFQHAARNVLFEDEAVLQRFRLTVDIGAGGNQGKKDPGASRTILQRKGSASEGSSGTAQSGWSLLRLNYSAQWPLHILLTPRVLDRYNSLFHFLLYVKRIQLELQQCWALQMQRKHRDAQDNCSSKWWLRNHMAFLVDNLQYYLQVDVIESQFSVLVDKIDSIHDFEAIQLAHDQFVTSLLSQSFLLMKPIAHCLEEILEQCHQFCSLVTQSEVILSDRQLSQIEDITKNFQRQSNLLFKILSSVRSHQASPHLAQLLLRIDYNKYFTLAGGQLGRYQNIRTAQPKTFTL